MTTTVTSIVTSTATVPSTSCVVGNDERILNIPYFADQADHTPLYHQAASSWYGVIKNHENWSTIRVGYTDTFLFVIVVAMDDYLWNDATPDIHDLTPWDGATLFLDIAGNNGNYIGPTMFKFTQQLGYPDDTTRRIAYQGDFSGWVETALDFSGTWTGFNGGGQPNSGNPAQGFYIGFEIPWASLGYTPEVGTNIGLAVITHDRDDAGGSILENKYWPQTFDDEKSSEWGKIVFGKDAWDYNPPDTTGDALSTLIDGVSGVEAPDQVVGGNTNCAADWLPSADDFITLWGDHVYARPVYSMNVQNQGNINDRICFSRFYITFPLDSLPAGKIVKSATLTLVQMGQSASWPDPPTADYSHIEISLISEDWDEATLSWNNGPIPVENVSEKAIHNIGPTVYINDGGAGGTDAVIIPTVVGGVITAYTVQNGGYGYHTPTVEITDDTGINATAHAHVSGGIVTDVHVDNGGTGYSEVVDTPRTWDLGYAVNKCYQEGTPLRLAFWSADDYGPHGKYFYTRDMAQALRPKLEITLGDLVAEDSWKMPGANPERTSWVSEEVGGQLYPLWYKNFESYIPSGFQIITAYDMLFISTANGLYALDATTGATVWVYATDMPLGNSPTIHRGVAYVGGMDKKLHAVDAYTGKRLWTFLAGAGFDTSPVIVDNVAYLGCRDGYFYAINIITGKQIWRYQTGGAIDYSAAYKDDVVYFASQDSYAYALNTDGTLLWKSDKLIGCGFQGFWPVIYGDYVIFAGSNNYLANARPCKDADPNLNIMHMERGELYPNNTLDPSGTLVGEIGQEPGDWVANTTTIDTNTPETTANGDTFPTAKYLKAKPWRRTYFVLNKNTGVEYTMDFDGNGGTNYAPIAWQSTLSGNRYPPIIGNDGVLYQNNNYLSNQYICGQGISGWKFGTPFISVVDGQWHAVDEPMAYSAGGKYIYFNLCVNRQAGSIDISIPETEFYDRYVNHGTRPPTGTDATREKIYFSYNLADADMCPNYNMYMGDIADDLWMTFGTTNGVYSQHGYQNPPIPYNGRVYMHRGNSVIAFSSVDVGTATQLATADIVPFVEVIYSPPVGELITTLEAEIQKVVDAGHLRSGYFSTGFLDYQTTRIYLGDMLLRYWHDPFENVITLLDAIPYLSAGLQSDLETYIQTEWSDYCYPTNDKNRLEYAIGAAHEAFTVPPESATDMTNMPATQTTVVYPGWQRNPMRFYAAWKYAQYFGNAHNIYHAFLSQYEALPTGSPQYLIDNPHVLNAYIAGRLGFLNLAALAGETENPTIRTEYNDLLALRVSDFTKDIPAFWLTDTNYYYGRALSVCRNWLYMTPELAQYLHDNALAAVTAALTEYDYVAPYWFKQKMEATCGEGSLNHLLDYPAIFAAKTLILQDDYTELAKYIDIPACPTGDFHYIQNLIFAIDSA